MSMETIPQNSPSNEGLRWNGIFVGIKHKKKVNPMALDKINNSDKKSNRFVSLANHKEMNSNRGDSF